jgi:ribosomal protein S18 acetylase RimI-like enzyme
VFTFKQFNQLFSEKVNDDVFWKGYEKKKEIETPMGTFTLVAKAGHLELNAQPAFKSKQFRVEVLNTHGAMVGRVNFIEKDGFLEAIDLKVEKKYRRMGLATELYKFARELGNSIRKSDMLTPLGQAFWSKKDHSA